MKKPVIANWGLKLLALLLAIALYYALKSDTSTFALRHDRPISSPR